MQIGRVVVVPVEDAPLGPGGQDTEKAPAEPLMLVSLAASGAVDWDALERKACDIAFGSCVKLTSALSHRPETLQNTSRSRWAKFVRRCRARPRNRSHLCPSAADWPRRLFAHFCPGFAVRGSVIYYALGART